MPTRQHPRRERLPKLPEGPQPLPQMKIRPHRRRILIRFLGHKRRQTAMTRLELHRLLRRLVGDSRRRSLPTPPTPAATATTPWSTHHDQDTTTAPQPNPPPPTPDPPPRPQRQPPRTPQTTSEQERAGAPGQPTAPLRLSKGPSTNHTIEHMFDQPPRRNSQHRERTLQAALRRQERRQVRTRGRAGDATQTPAQSGPRVRHHR